MLVISAEARCDVCFEHFHENRVPYSTPCGHVFCKPCLENVVWHICPTCRRPYRLRRLVRLHGDFHALPRSSVPSSSSALPSSSPASPSTSPSPAPSFYTTSPTPPVPGAFPAPSAQAHRNYRVLPQSPPPSPASSLPPHATPFISIVSNAPPVPFSPQASLPEASADAQNNSVNFRVPYTAALVALTARMQNLHARLCAATLFTVSPLIRDPFTVWLYFAFEIAAVVRDCEALLRCVTAYRATMEVASAARRSSGRRFFLRLRLRRRSSTASRDSTTTTLLQGLTYDLYFLETVVVTWKAVSPEDGAGHLSKRDIANALDSIGFLLRSRPE